MKHARTLLILSSLLLLGSTVLSAQVAPADPAVRMLSQGKQFFQQGRYADALSSFRELSMSSGSLQAEAIFWQVKSALALNRLDDAQVTLEAWLAKYPKDPNRVEGLYLRARILYLSADIPAAVAAFSAFLEHNKASAFSGNACYWLAEGLMSLGKLDEAETFFRKVLTEYSTSFKVEAASYKLGLITLKRREEELLALLTWSHEENIKNIDDFQRREFAYQEAIRAYQTRLLRLAPEDFKAELQILQGRFEQVQTRLTAAEARRDELNAQLKDAQTRLLAANERVALLEKELTRATSGTSGVQELLEERQRLLDAKEEALRQKEKALEALELQNRSTP